MALVDVQKAALDFIAEIAGSQERKKQTLLDTQELQVFLLYVRQNGRVPAHQAKGEITVQVLRGDIRMSAGGQEHRMAPGCLLPVGANVPHELWADEDSVCLVTMAKPH